MNCDLTSHCTDCRYRGRHIYVIGAHRFERELVLDFIRTHTEAKWFEAERLEDVPDSNQDNPFGQKMILLDTNNITRDNLVDMFASKAWKAHAHNLMALFNVQHDYEIEKVALKNGVRGFLYSDDHLEDLVNGICAINSGELWISRRLITECLLDSYIGKELPKPADHSLSKREVELLQALSIGASNDTIADRMCISSHTVKTHLHNIFRKINVDNRLEAVLWAKENL